MKKLFSAADAYIAKMNWKDLALVKLCLCAAGVMLGLAAPQTGAEVGGPWGGGGVCGHLSAHYAEIPPPSGGGAAGEVKEHMYGKRETI